MNIELHVIEGGVDLGPIPSVESCDLSPVFCDFGSISFTYPRNGKKFNLLDGKDEVEIVPYINGQKQPQLGGLVQEISGDDVAEAGLLTFAGIGYLRLLEEVRVYPYAWPSYDPLNPTWKFVDQKPGQMLGALLAAAQARGSLQGVTWTFTNTLDSNGVPWAKQISLEIKPGITMVDVLNSLHGNGMIEFEMYGRELRVYNDGTFGADRTAQTVPLVFRRGRDLTDSPRKTSVREVATVMLAAGKEDTGIYHEEADATAIAGRRRIEGYVSNGSITDAGTLDAFSTYQLAGSVNPKMEKTHGLSFVHPRSPQPIRDFAVGDWAWSDVGKGQEKLRIKQWVLKLGADGKVTGSVVMNDLFAEAEERLSKRIAGIVGGTTITGESRAEVAVADLIDTLPPSIPAGLSLSSLAYVDNQGQTYAQVSATWIQVTTNSDLTVCDDLAGYQVRWRYTTDGAGYWRGLGTVEGTLTSWSPVTPGVNVQAQVQAFDRSGNVSGWSATQTILTGADATPPEAPTAPVVDNYLGLLRVQYAGASSSGAAWPADYVGVEVHVSAVNNFTPTSATRIDFLTAAGSSFYEGTYATTLYAKLVAVDRSGNKSTPSAQGSGVPTQILSADVFDGAIGTAKLADLAVTNAKIANLAVNDAQIGAVSAGKITAGIITAAVTVSGRIATALTGKRMELNGVGLQGWDTAGNLTVSIDGVSNTLTGVFQTAMTGRRIQIGAGGNVGQMDFIAPDGTQTYIRGRTESTGIEAIQLAVPIVSNAGATGDSLWNRVNVNTDEWMSFRANRIDNYFGNHDTTKRGAFWVRQSNDRGATTITRMQINYQNVTMYGDSTDNYWQYNFSNGEVRFSYGVNKGDIWARQNGGVKEQSPLWSIYTGWGNAVQQKVYYNPATPTFPLALEMRNVNDDGFERIRATSFDAQSASTSKTGMKAAKDDFLAGVKSTGIKRFKRKKDLPGMAEEVGWAAEEMPAQLVSKGDRGTEDAFVSIPQTVAWLWGALSQAVDRIEALEAKP